MPLAAETFLVVVDQTAESLKALRFSALRAVHTGARVKLMHVLKPTQFLQWGAVQAAMDAEAEELAAAMLTAKAAEVQMLTGNVPETVLLRGEATEQILAVLDEDRSVRVLVLAAAASGRPGPLVDFFAGERAGSLPCLVMIVPGGISDSELDRLT